MMNGNRELIILMCALSVICHATWGVAGALLFGAPAAAACLAILQALAVNMFVLWPGRRVQHWLAGVMAPAIIGTAAFVAIRGGAVVTSLALFGAATVFAHVALFVVSGGFRRSPPPTM